MKLKIGGHSANVLLERMQTSGIGLNDHAIRYIDALRYHVTIISRTIDIQMLTCAQLGLPGGGRLLDIYDRAKSLGCAPCPPDTALYLRIALPDQPASAASELACGKCPDGAINVASVPIFTGEPLHRGLYLRNVDGRLWLRGYVCDDDYVWPAESVFAFVTGSAGIGTCLSK